jgi:fimbrial isopeptide formation D2 family protein/LPXTG-motif cell wall-anchored protein
MRKSKKLVGLLFLAALILAMSTGFFAAASDDQTYTITVNTLEGGHTYEVYQIFIGDMSADGVLSNIEWGSGVTAAGKALFDSAEQAAEELEAGTTSNADTFAKKIAAYLADPAGTTTSESGGTYSISDLAAGYYLIKDKDESLSSDANSAYTRFMLQIVKDVTVDPKSSTPTVVKKVKDIDDSNASDNTNNAWMDSADYDIGDDVPFQLTATLPANVTYYDTYKLVFHDTLSKGFTYNENSLSVQLGETDISNGYAVNTTVNEAGETLLTITFDNVNVQNNVRDSEKVTIEYTAKLNENAVIGSAGNTNKVYLEFSNNPNNSSDTGKTPEDLVTVFTYQLVINKVDTDSNPLAGAEFTLTKKLSDGSVKTISPTKNEAGTIFTFTGLDDGIYQLDETTTPEGYNTIDQIIFNIDAEHSVTADSPALSDLKGEKDADSPGNVALTNVNGVLTGNIKNKKGNVLPTTGGMGTKIFTITGVILILGTLVLFVTKKRMDMDKVRK